MIITPTNTGHSTSIVVDQLLIKLVIMSKKYCFFPNPLLSITRIIDSLKRKSSPVLAKIGIQSANQNAVFDTACRFFLQFFELMCHSVIHIFPKGRGKLHFHAPIIGALVRSTVQVCDRPAQKNMIGSTVIGNRNLAQNIYVELPTR